jgi:hypothetical protein
MQRVLTATLLLTILSANLPAHAADTVVKLPIAAAFDANDARARLGDSVKFYFADQPTPKVVSQLGTDKTSLRTNGFGKGTVKACNWVFLSAMLQLQKHAKEVGANAVINIVSNYKDQPMVSQTEFECHDGAIMAGVAFKGDFVKVAD